MGGGDVKLAGVVGVMLGFAGWDAVALGLFAGFLGGGLYSVVLLVRRRADRRTAVPFGPWMLLGAWVGLAAHLAAG
jgi:leader peptidase (prepilin peptidase)/N-methyltransferase